MVTTSVIGRLQHLRGQRAQTVGLACMWGVEPCFCSLRVDVTVAGALGGVLTATRQLWQGLRLQLQGLFLNWVWAQAISPSCRCIALVCQTLPPSLVLLPQIPQSPCHLSPPAVTSDCTRLGWHSCITPFQAKPLRLLSPTTDDRTNSGEPTL